jgi:hypothetical protein
MWHNKYVITWGLLPTARTGRGPSRGLRLLCNPAGRRFVQRQTTVAASTRTGGRP